MSTLELPDQRMEFKCTRGPTRLDRDSFFNLRIEGLEFSLRANEDLATRLREPKRQAELGAELRAVYQLALRLWIDRAAADLEDTQASRSQREYWGARVEQANEDHDTMDFILSRWAETDRRFSACTKGGHGWPEETTRRT